MEPTEDQLRAVTDLYEAGRNASALRLAESFAPLRSWRGASARVLAGRVAMNAGAPRLGRILHRLAQREDPSHPEAMYYAARDLFERRGTLVAWEFMESAGDLPDALPRVRADWLAFRGFLCSWFRDFDAAEGWLAKAEALAPEHTWLLCERSHLMEREDRYPEALAAARKALELRPWFRPGVQAAAHALQLLDRDAEALDLLIEATGILESAPVAAQLATLQTDLRLYADARATWDRVVELCPLMEKAFAKFLNANRADAAYYCGDHPAAIALGRESKNDFHVKVADRLEESARLPEEHRRRAVLPVGFVRQHHMTCAPATLSAISRYWDVPTEHLALAEEICYDGTPAHSERKWAQEHGWTAVEFTVTWDSARALLDRGVPFTLTTTEATNSHLQAAIGYDSLRGTLLIRDPFQRSFGEFIAEPFFERYRWAGPRGMVMVPSGREALLEGIQLPERELYDDYYRLQAALAKHDRAAAGDALTAMAARAPESQLWRWARRALAFYDGDPIEGLAATDESLAMFPDNVNLLMAKLSLLRTLGRRNERLELLEAAARVKEGGPLFWSEHARELRDDVREHARSERLLRRALRYLRADAWQHQSLANALWDQRRFVESLALYRFAATLGDKDEGLARSYFIACRHFKATEAALGFLHRRIDRAGRLSSQPARTLFWALEDLGRAPEGFEALEAAMRIRPEDGDLLLTAANARARFGSLQAAEALLARAEHKCHRAAWLRSSAEIASLRGEPERAKSIWRQILANEPLAMDAHNQLARLLSESEGIAATRSHLADASSRFPHYYPLHQLWVSWLRDEDPAVSEPVIRKLIENHPTDSWARRELIQLLTNCRRMDEALTESESLLKSDPGSASTQYFHAKALQGVGRRVEARAALRQAVVLGIDADFAIRALIDAHDTIQERREALAFVHSELVRQTIFGDGLLAFRAIAAELLEPDEILLKLREALLARPDLWHAWSAVVRQLTAMNQLDEAATLAEEASRRFPLLPRLWYDLAEVYRLRGEVDAELAALQEALQIAPGWSIVARRLAAVHDRRGEFEQEEKFLAHALARAPLDPVNHGEMADLLWKTGRREQAVERVARAIELEPEYTWAWDVLEKWSVVLKKPGLAQERARNLTFKRGGEARSWMILARVLPATKLEERLAALEKAIELNPRFVDAMDIRAELLAAAGRMPEAEAACKPAVFGDAIPLPLRGRLAWVCAQAGDHAQAIELMRAAVIENPNYYWGWQQLVNWSRRTGDNAERFRAATEMVRHWPHDVTALAALAEAMLATEDRAGAVATYSRALELAPDYEYAATRLFDLLMEDGLHQEAGGPLTALELHHGGPLADARRVEWSAKTGDRGTAVQRLAKLCVTPWEGTWPIDAAVKAIATAGWSEELEVVLDQALKMDDAVPQVAEHFIVALSRKKRWDECISRIDQLAPRGAVAASAADAFMRGLARNFEKKILRKFISTHAGMLRRHARAWGAAGFALHTLKLYEDVIHWMTEWNRDDAEGWMLVNYAEALRALDRDGAAAPVNRKGLLLSGSGETARGIHSLWLAADALLGNDLDAASQLLDEPMIQRLTKSYTFMSALLRATLRVLRAPNAKQAFVIARRGIVTAAKKYPGLIGDREQFLLQRKCLHRLRRERIGFTGKLWCWIRHHSSENFHKVS